MKLKVSVVQMAVAVADPERNLARAEAWIAEAARQGSDIVCFPEMWTTGFDWDWNAAHLDEQEAIIERVAAMARHHGIWVNGSMLAPNDAGRAANTCILFDGQGNRVAVYRKVHLFSYMHEDRHMAPGDALTVAQTPWGPVGLSVCYDIRFPEIYRSLALKGARVVLSPTAFPFPRLEHWKILVRARAIENQMFMVGPNQVGREGPEDEDGVIYFGHSVVVDPWGETLVEGGGDQELLLTATLDLDRVDETRLKMRIFQDRRPGLYELG